MFQRFPETPFNVVQLSSARAQNFYCPPVKYFLGPNMTRLLPLCRSSSKPRQTLGTYGGHWGGCMRVRVGSVRPSRLLGQSRRIPTPRVARSRWLLFIPH